MQPAGEALRSPASDPNRLSAPNFSTMINSTVAGIIAAVCVLIGWGIGAYQMYQVMKKRF